MMHPRFALGRLMVAENPIDRWAANTLDMSTDRKDVWICNYEELHMSGSQFGIIRGTE